MSDVENPKDFVIAAKDLGVKYDLRLKRRRTFRHTASQILRGGASLTLGRDEFWALQDVSFGLRQGEVLGLVGVNGSGKSTLLQVIAGVLRADAGAITTYGHSATLLTIGRGFEADLTGRENIYLNAAYLGFRRDGIEAHFAEIAEFSELGKFIEAPVATYSMGMRARLGFSIAAHLDPEILLLDEVLGVGDANFREKSRQKLQQLMTTAQAVVIVSHTGRFVTDIATKVLWLEGGTVKAFGEPYEIMERYDEATRFRRRPVPEVA